MDKLFCRNETIFFYVPSLQQLITGFYVAKNLKKQIYTRLWLRSKNCKIFFHLNMTTSLNSTSAEVFVKDSWIPGWQMCPWIPCASWSEWIVHPYKHRTEFYFKSIENVFVLIVYICTISVTLIFLGTNIFFFI